MITAITTLIHDIHDREAHLFFAEHRDELDVRQALRSAFRTWAQTPEGQTFIDQNGSNWGDATAIPAPFLEAQGLRAYRNAFTYKTTTRTWQADLRLATIGYRDHLVVDHDESLLDP